MSAKVEAQNIELQILINDTNELYKVFYNQSYYPTLPEYYLYLSESLKLANPEMFQLRREYPNDDKNPQNPEKYLIRDSSELRDGLSLVLLRDKKPKIPKPLVNPEDLGRKRDTKGGSKLLKQSIKTKHDLP